MQENHSNTNTKLVLRARTQVRTACTTGMKLVPSRDSMFRVFGRTKTTEVTKIEQDLKVMLVSFNIFVSEMDDWFEKNGFNFPEKC